MSIKKQFLKSKPICKVTFRIPKEVGKIYSEASLLGEFNDWTQGTNKMKKLKSGDFTCVVELPQDQTFTFRYLLGLETWSNDEGADGSMENEFGTTNSVVSTIC